MSVVFRTKVLEAHSERLYGTLTEDGSESESGSSSTKESSPPQRQVVLAESTSAISDCDLEKDSEGVSIHEQHERFMEKQIQLATSYKEKQEQLPRTISSKRSAKSEEESCEDFVPRKKERLSSYASEVEKPVERESGVKGPRTVSRAEKNKRRKLKKKKRLARKS